MITGRRSAAMRPAKPRPSGIRTPCSTSSSMPLAAARDELAGGLVEQQEGGGVGVQDLGDALQQLGQQLVQRQVGQRGVGDALDAPCERAPPCARSRSNARACSIAQRRPVGDELEQVAVGGGELARRERADVQDAGDLALDQQRDAEQRADALLAQDRVVDVGVVDVLDDHGAALGGDAAGEAAAERDPHALLDLLLDALGRAGDELAGRLVEQQERRRVGAEDVGDPLQQLRQQLVEREMGERRVRDALHGEQDVRRLARVRSRAAMLRGGDVGARRVAAGQRALHETFTPISTSTTSSSIVASTLTSAGTPWRVAPKMNSGNVCVWPALNDVIT